MKRLNHLYPKIIAFDNLLLAYQKAKRGKNNRTDVAQFSLSLEKNLFLIQHDLNNQCYQFGEYRLFTIYERKPRQIVAAPFRDRVVHHAIMNVLTPLLDNRFIFASYACRKNKGVHKAVDRYQLWARKHRYVLKLDISQYFASIDHNVLRQILRKHLKDELLLRLLDNLITTAPKNSTDIGKSIPIGNLTSQFFANLYLNDFDHFIKEQLKIKSYLRYVDDLFLLHNRKQVLWQTKQAIDDYLASLMLLIHPKKVQLRQVTEGLDVLGYRVYPFKRQLRNDNGFRFWRKLRKFAKKYQYGKIMLSDIRPSVMAWIGHARHGRTQKLRKVIFSSVIFKRV